MLLKGLYNTKVDRMTTDNYKRYMMQTFGIFVEEDWRRIKIKGFIMTHVWYDIYVPIVIDGDITSFKHEQMRHLSTQDGIVNAKLRIKEDIKERPDYYKQLAAIMISKKGR